MNTETLTLTDFLLARILEDEEAVWDLALEDRPRWLAKCDACRRIAYLHGPGGNGMKPNGDECSEFEDWPCATIRILALPYADHPDYREEWRP